MLRIASKRWCTGAPTREQLLRLSIKDLTTLAKKKRLSTSDCIEKSHIIDKILGQDGKLQGGTNEVREYKEIGFFTKNEKQMLSVLSGLLLTYVIYRIWKMMEDDEVTKLRKATENGDLIAKKELAKRLSSGDGTHSDSETAFKLLLELADEQKDPWAQCEVGGMYCRGHGVEANIPNCFEYMLLSAKQGNVNAMYNVADLYKDGIGTNRDHDNALKWKMNAMGSQSTAKERLEAGLAPIISKPAD